MAVVLCGMTAFGQTLADYKFATGTDANMWKTLSSPTTILSTECDGCASSVQNIGFTFTFGGTNYTQFSVNSDGNLKFGSTATGSGSYTTPFSSSKAAANSPKINFFGCDGYLPSSANGGYVKYQLFGTSPNRVAVVEFSTNTYSQRSNNYNFKWQVQLYERSNRILIVYPSTVPSVLPSVARQVGMCTGANDIILVSASHVMTHYTSGQDASIAASTWPDANRYYLFDPSVIPMELGLTYTGTLGTLGVWKTYAGCSYNEYGEEQVFSFTPQFSSSYIFTATQTSSDPDFFLMSSFGNSGTNVIGGCWGSGTKTVSLTGGTTYYLVAENFKTTETSGYAVSVEVTPATIPYTCSFDTDSESGPWTFANGTQTNYWMIGSSTYSSSSKSLYITNDGSSNAFTISSAASSVYAYRNLTFASAGNYVVSFKWKGYGESTYDYMRAFLVPVSVETLNAGNNNGITTTNTPTDWIAVDGGSKLNLQSNWQVNTKTVNVPTVGEYNLVFYWKNDNSQGTQPPAAVDDIEVAAPCTATAAISVGSVMTTSAVVTRTSGSGVKYDVLVSTSSNPANATESPVEMTSTTQTITGLTPATQYYAYIRSYCSEYRHGAWSNAVSFVTACDKTSTLSAEVQGSSSVLLTRTSGNGVKYDILVSTSSNPATATESPIAMTSTTQTVSGLTPATQYYAYIRSYCTQNIYGEWSSAVSFVTTCDKTSTLSAEVQGSSSVLLTRTSGNGVKYDILVSTSSNPATATESPIAMTSTTQTVSGLTPATQYYAYIRSYCTASIYGEWSSAVGFVTYDVCSAVSNLTATAGPAAAGITWSYAGQVARYQLFVSPTAMTESELENAELIEVTDPSYTATGLSAVTGYYVYVRPVCNDYESGTWTSVRFTTLNDVCQLPYYENFEDVASIAWTTTNGTNGWYVGSATSNGGNNSLYISNNNGVSNEYSISTTSYSYAYCKLNINEQSVVNVSFDWKGNGEGSYDLLRAFMIPVSENPTLSGDNGMPSMSNDAPASWIDVSQNGGKLNLSTTWDHSSKDVVFFETGNYYLVFFWKNDGSTGTQPPAAVDNISVELVSTCMPVQNVIAAPGRDRAVISWDEISTSSQWQVLVSTSSSVSSATETPVGANSNSITISNLERNTTYYAFVRALCSESESSPWSDAVSFTTLDECSPVSNLSIDGYSSNSADLSWTCLDADAGLWQVIVTTADDIESATEEPLMVYNTSAMVSGLTPNAQYNVFVRTDCGEYGYSEWESVSFKTSPVSVSLPYFVDFEGTYAENWVFENGSNGWFVGRSTNNGGWRSLYISNDMGVTNSYDTRTPTSSYAYFTFNIEQTSVVNMSFDWKCKGESGYDYLRVFIVPASLHPSFSAGDRNGIEYYYWGHPSGWITVDDGQLNESESWNTLSKNVTLDEGLYYAVFYWYNDYSGGDFPPAAVDNVSVSVATTCIYDGYVSVSDVGKTWATVSWSDSDDISQWEVLVTTASNPDEATETPMLLDVTSTTVDNLTAGTDYYVYVRAYCSESSKGIWYGYDFTTLPSCLSVDYVDEETLGQTWVQLVWKNDDEVATQWEVLVSLSDDPSNATESIVLASDTTVTINGLEPNTQYYAYVRAKCSESEYSEWKYTWFTTYPPCVPPYDFNALVSRTSAKVMWYNVYNRLGTRIVISETEKTDVQLADEEYVPCITRYKNFYDLTPGQTYHVYAATECGNDEHGDWVHYQFTTPELNAMPLPYTQNFEDGVMANWEISNDDKAWYCGSAAANESTMSLYISKDNGYTNEYIGGSGSWRYYYSYAYCRLNIDHPGVVRVQFDWRCYGRYDVDCLRAYLVPVSLSPYFSGSNGISGSNVPSGWISVTSTTALSEYYVPGGGYNWQTNTYDLNITTTGDYYLVYVWMNYVMDNHNPPAAVDNISVSYITDCVFYGNVNVDNVGKTSVDVSWSTAGPATQWQILVTEADSPESAPETPILVSSTPYTVTGLDMNTTYHTYVRSYCSASDQGIWVRASDFTTLPPCEPPYGISAVVNPTSVFLNWGQPYQYDNYNVYISQSTMTDAQLASADFTNITTNYYSKSGLSAGQTYYAYISSACALGETSEWVEYVFQTPENALVTLPYYQNFEGSQIEGWNLSNADNGWYVGTATAQSGDGSLYVSKDGGMSNTYSALSSGYSYAYCKFHIDERTVANVSFDWKCQGNMYDFLVVYVVPASASPTFTGGSGYNSSNSWINVAEELLYRSDWNHYSHDVEMLNEGDYYLVFLWKNDWYSYSSYDPPAAIDNLAIVPLSKENDITSFMFAGMIDAVIDTDTHIVTCSVPYSMNLGGIKPTVTVSQAATISPASETYINLNSPFIYVVTSEDGTEQEWMIIANRLPVSSEAEILSFWTDGLLSVDIDSENATVDAVISRMYDITAVSPTFVLSNLATINHTTGTTYNFSSPRQFVVTAEDRSIKNWTVNVAYGDSPLGADCVNPYVVDAENDLPYLHSSTTTGLYNMYNTYNFEYPLVLEGNDAVYRIDLPYMMRLNISVSSPTDIFNVFVMNSCGTLASYIVDYRTDILDSETLTVDLPAGSSFVIVDTYTEYLEYQIQITRISNCYDVDDLHATRLQNELDVAWTSYNVGDNWTLKYGLEGFDIDTEGTQVVVNEPNYAITGLQESTRYDIYVRANCGAIGNSNWTQITTSTIGSCQMPEDLAVVEISDMDAELSWEGFNMAQWQVQYKRDDESQYTTLTVDEPTLTLTGLQHSTTYNVRVRSICGGSYSDFVELDITTECTIVREFPFVENFNGETFPPLCWSQERTAAGSGAGLGYANGAWMRSTSATDDNSTPKAMLADAKAGSVHNLASIGIMFAESLNGYDVSLDVSRSATSEASAEEGVEVWVNSYPDIVNGTPVMLGYISKNYQTESENIPAEREAGWYTYSFSLRDRVGVNYVILVGKANNAGGVYVDNLKVEKTVDCLAPSNLVVESEDEHNVVLSWSDANAIQGTWTVRYSLNGGNVVETSVDEPQLTITGLQAGVTYSISAEIQGICAAGMESDWYSTTVEATTNCLPLDLPYTQTFAVADGNLPDCWKSVGDGNMVWSVSNGAAYKPTGSRQSVTHLLSPSFNFDGEKYMLEFDVKQSTLNISQSDLLYVQFITETTETISNISIQNSAENGMVRMSVAVPQYSGIAQFDFVLDGYRECTIDSVVVRSMNREADILTFEIPGQTSSEINAETAEINVGVVYGTDITALSPIFTISEKASVDVASGEERDFSSPVVYVVTAEDTDYTRQWTVNVSIDESSCPNPTVDDINIVAAADSAELTIAQVYNETSYNLKVSSQSIDPETEAGDIFDGVVGNVSSVAGLHYYTYYYIYVQSNCGASGWTETGFSTLCGAYELPYTQDFSADAECWEIIDANDDGKTWNLNGSEATYVFSRTNRADDYLVSPMISIIRNAKLEFKYRVGNFSYPETFSVYVANSSDTVRLETLTVNNEEFRTFGPVDLSDFAGQETRIMIKCESDPYMYRLYVDDFSVSVSDYVFDVSTVGRGTVTPSGRVEVANGEDIVFAIMPDDYNELLSLTLDGEDVTDDIVEGTYTVAEVHEEHSLVATFTERYTITASAAEGGHIVTEGVTVVDRGGSVSYVVIPDDDYRLGLIMVDGEVVQLEQGSFIYTFENVEADHIINAIFERIIYHTVHVVADANGTVDPRGDVRVVDGENLSLVVIPNDGYRVRNFVVDNNDVTDYLIANGNTFIFENVIEDHNVHASFIENTYYTITATCGNHGTITPRGEIPVLSGDDQSFIVTADDGYHIASVTVDDVDVTRQLLDGVYTFNDVGEEHSIHAEFAINTYMVVAYAQGGTITPSGSVSVNHGDNLTFEFYPDNEYEFFNMMVDNQSVEVVGNMYSIDNVTADHVVVVVFVPMNIVRYEIEATAGSHGTILPGGRVRVVEGENQNFQIVPDEHYYISSLSVDGISIAVSDEYLFENVTSDHTISATFEAYKHTVTAIAGSHGSVTPSGSVEVDEGSSITFEFSPNVGYMVSEVLVDGVNVEFTGNSYTLENVLENHTVNVNFDLLPMWSVTAVVGAHGSIEPEGTNYVLDGDNIEFTFIPDDGYMLDRVVVDGHAVEVDGNTYLFENVTEDHYIYVSFRSLAYFITATVRAHGTISPSGVVELEPGSSQTFTFNPYIGYELDSVFVDGDYVETDGNTYEFTDVYSNHTIEVAFRHIPVSIVDEVVSASLYPNPNDGRFMVDFAGISGDVVYQLVDASGAIVDVRDIYVDEGMTMEFYHDLKPGVYFARFISYDKVLLERFVVE